MSESMFYLHKMYFLYNSTFAHRIFKAWQEKYSVCNIYENIGIYKTVDIWKKLCL